MGDLRPDNPPDDGGGARHRGLPDLPPEWGTVIIPDDAAALEEEAAAVRRELRRARRGTRLRTALGLPPTTDGRPSLGVPVVVMVVAVLTSLVSLFVVTWGRPENPPLPPVDAAGAPEVPATAKEAISEVVLVDASGVRVRLGTLLPAVVLLVDGCECAPLVIDTATAVPAGVRVVPVGRTAPLVFGAPTNVRALADTDSVLRTRHAAGTSVAPASATALVVDAAGGIAAVVTEVDTVGDLLPALERL